jgi:apolipoprotein D and lipocalin family protein
VKEEETVRFIILFIIISLLISNGLSAKKLPPLTTVERIDLMRYAGLWYQFAYFPNTFQPKDAKLTTAEYTLHSKGHIIVKNTAYADFEGKKVKSDITGKAFVEDKQNFSKLKVQFFWPFRAPYWIILLDKDNYQWAVVSDPSRKYLWILTRKPTLDRDLYYSLIEQIKAKHIDTNKIVITGKFE